MAALQLVAFEDRFGNVYPAAYAKISAIYTTIPAGATVETEIDIYKDQPAFAAGKEFIIKDRQNLAFNPFSPTAQTDAYDALQAAGGIYAGSIDVA